MMTAVSNSSDFLVSSNPNDALLFSVNERNGVRTDSAQGLPVIASAESSCATTKAVEVCVNGVKQVIIIPQALSSNDVATVSSTTFLPGCQSSSSSVIGSALLDNRPDDVKLLAESCVQVTSSSVSSFGTPVVFSAASATNGHMHVSTGFADHTIPPPPYQLFNVNHMPFLNSPAKAVQNLCIAASPQFYANSVSNRAILPSGIIPHSSPSLPAVPNLSTPVLPVYGFPPAQLASSAMSLPTPLRQPFLFSPDRNTLPPSQMQPGLNHLQHLLPSTISQAPWTPYCPLHMPTYGRNNAPMVTVVDNYLQPGPSITAHRAMFDMSMSNYRSTDFRHFLPSLQRAITTNLPVNQYQYQYQDYLFRKRGVLPQNPAQGLQADAGNCYVPQSDPRLFASRGVTFQRPPQINANEVQTSYSNPSLALTTSYLSQSNLNSGKGVRKHKTVCKSRKDSVNDNNVHSLSSASQEKVSFEYPNVWCAPQRLLNSGILHSVTSAMCQTTASSASLMISNHSERPQNNSITSCCRPEVDVKTDLQVTLNLTQPTSLAVMTIATTSIVSVATYATETASLSVLPQNNTSTPCCQPVTGVPADLQVTVKQTWPIPLPLMTIPESSVATATTYAETSCHPTAVVQASAVTESNSTEDLMLDTLLFDVCSDLTATSVPSNYNLTPNPVLSHLLSSDLFPLNSVSIADASHSVTGSDTVQQSSKGLENGTLQLGDSSNDLGSCPADVMVETAESESLLTSFCNMFDQSNVTDQQSAGVSSVVMSDGDKDCLKNAEQHKDSSVCVHHENAERGLQIAKSLGKGRHFAEVMRQQRQEQAGRKRQRTRLTSLEVADESNSSDSWHPDSQSESSDNQTVSSPCPSTVSSISQSSDDFVVISRQAKRRQMVHTKRKRSSHRIVCSAKKSGNAAVHTLPHDVTQKCSVNLERLQLQGRHSVNVRLLDHLICCPQYSSVKPVQRIVSSDSECSEADWQPTKKLRIKSPHIEDTESS